MSVEVSANTNTSIDDFKNINKYTLLSAGRKQRARDLCAQTSFKMNSLAVFTFFAVVTLLSTSSVHSAAVDLSTPATEASTSTSTEAPKTSTIITSTSSPSSTSAKTSTVTSITPETTTPRTCHNSTPCGWAVYIPFVRRVDYFMRNTCMCPPEKSCQRFEDDLSISAYVFRCGPKLETTENYENTY